MSSRPNNPTPKPEDTSSFPQLETFRSGLSSFQPQLDFVGLRVVHEPEEVRDMNDLRTGFLQRHRKWLYDPIDLAPPPAKKDCPERDGEDPTAEVPLLAMAHPDEASSSAATAVQPDTAGSDAAATTRPEVPGLSAATVAQPGLTAHSNAPTTMETRGTEGVPEAAIDEKASDKKSSPATTVPLRWEEMMEMLKGVPCFTDAEAHSTRMSDFFSLAKRVSVNMGGDPPAFVKARLLFGTPEPAVSCIQHL